jgi:glycosyltransferase involved in cell wall biosynthesis
VRIVFLDPSGELGGAETALLDLLAALRDARPRWTLSLVTSGDGPLLSRARSLQVAATSLAFPPSIASLGEWGNRGSIEGAMRLGAALGNAAVPAVQYVRRLRRHLRELAPAIVHTNGFKMHLLGARACPRGAHVIWHVHDYPSSRPLTAKLLIFEAPRCSAVIANSESVAQQSRDLFGPRMPIHAIHNAVDLDRFTPEGARSDLDALSKLPPAAPGHLRVGLVGTFARWKGHEVFLDALAELQPTGRVRGYIIGGPIYETSGSQFTLRELKDLAIAKGVGESVGFTGHIEDVPAAIRALDVVVHASVEPEPFGLVIAEAMACGRPVIVSRAGGAAEIAEGGALFHTPGNATELAECLAKLVANSSLRAALGAAGRKAAVRLFGRQRLSDALVPIYTSLTSLASLTTGS